MYKSSVLHWPFLLALFLSASVMPGYLWSAPLEASSFPLEFNSMGGQVLVHHPVISNWKDFEVLSGRMPLEVTPAGSSAWFGSLSFEVDTVIHFSDRLVSLHHPQISDLKGDGGPPSDEVLRLVREAMKNGEENISLDYLLRALPDDFQIPGT